MNTAIRSLTACMAAAILIGCADKSYEAGAGAARPTPQPEKPAAVPEGGDANLLGVWVPETWMSGGTAHPFQSGLMVITPRYLIVDAIYDLGEKKKPTPDASANYGTYKVTSPGLLVMDQAMQLHWVSDAARADGAPGTGTFFKQKVPESIKYDVSGDTLRLFFEVPGEQSWILKRQSAESIGPSSASR
ncbi:MAG: hypothetical protein ABI885_03490 [Gammaproteobacteria bacterium]